MEIKIDNNTYKISDDLHYNTTIAKTQIILSLSLRKSNYHIIRQQHKDYGKAKNWNTFTISREGKIYQHYDPKYHTDFMGIKEIDKKSISIVLENMGILFNENGNFVNWLNESCDPKRVIEQNWLSYHYWEKIDLPQINSTVHLCKQLSKEFGIPSDIIEFHYYHKGMENYKGIAFKSNYIEDNRTYRHFYTILSLLKNSRNEKHT